MLLLYVCVLFLLLIALSRHDNTLTANYVSYDAMNNNIIIIYYFMYVHLYSYC
jgi:hypothetical protein